MSTDEVHAFSQSAEKRRSFKKKAMPKRSTEKEQLAYDGKFCGYKHERLREKCPAWGKECKLCKSLNHFASKCRQKSRHTQQHRVHLLDKDTDSENEIMVVNNSSTKSKIFAQMTLADRSLRFQVDSGATCNVISKSDLPAATAITESVKVISLYNKSTMTSLGSSELCVTNPKNGASYNMTFVVIDAEVTPIIGSQSAQEMNLLKIQYQNILKIDDDNKTLTKSSMGESYADVLSGEGKMEGTLHLEVDETVSPVILPPRRVPVAMKQPLKDELTRLQEMGVIAEVDTPTDWVSSMVIVKKKSGKIRLCIDPKPLNKALKRSHYMLPVIEDIIPELTSAKVFTVCDVKNGFWHVELDQQSSYLTTFQTPYGRYRYCRMPFGISPAPEYFQQRLHQALEKIPGVFIIADDILVAGCGETAAEAEKDHDMKMTQLLERCREKNIKLNKEKLLWKRSEVSYMGHLITAEGLQVDPAKVEAILKMPQPHDKRSVQRLLGMVNYLQKFAKGISGVTQPLRDLIKDDTDFLWDESVHGAAVVKIKKMLSETPVLRYFDPSVPLTLQCDASERGLGACILQKEQPIAYASRSLTDAETRYAQIEKEMLAIIFGLKRFDHYAYGRPITVESDHKPLEMINKKALQAAPKRLQRMLLRAQRYEIDIIYKKGCHMYIADTLSRA